MAVIGDEAKRRLFSGELAVGGNIRINGMTFQVVGVYQHKVQGGDNNDNTMVVIPFSTMGDLYNTEYITGMAMDYEGEDHQPARARGPGRARRAPQLPSGRPPRRVHRRLSKKISTSSRS